jgi:predicted ArsR family transcriptional regulator
MVSGIRKWLTSFTSTEANTQVTKAEGKVGQQALLLAVIQKSSGGLINGELADLSGLGREQVFRRMPELEQLGHVERHYGEDGRAVHRPHKGYKQQVWFLVQKKGEFNG